MRSVDRTLLKLDYFLVKHEEVRPAYDRPDAADDPRAATHRVEEKAPGEKDLPEVPVGMEGEHLNVLEQHGLIRKLLNI